MTRRELEPCDDGTQNHDWHEADLGCELCGEHSGYMCYTCCETVDNVWDDEHYVRITEEKNA